MGHDPVSARSPCSVGGGDGILAWNLNFPSWPYQSCPVVATPFSIFTATVSQLLPLLMPKAEASTTFPKAPWPRTLPVGAGVQPGNCKEVRVGNRGSLSQGPGLGPLCQTGSAWAAAAGQEGEDRQTGSPQHPLQAGVTGPPSSRQQEVTPGGLGTRSLGCGSGMHTQRDISARWGPSWHKF